VATLYILSHSIPHKIFLFILTPTKSYNINIHLIEIVGLELFSINAEISLLVEPKGGCPQAAGSITKQPTNYYSLNMDL
jgi:hypothetical protein